MIYRIYKTIGRGAQNAAMTIDTTPQVSFIFDPANTDYQRFKTEINADEAQLEDADSVLMTAEEAKAFVKELP